MASPSALRRPMETLTHADGARSSFVAIARGNRLERVANNGFVQGFAL
jgi:hypothetical protein